MIKRLLISFISFSILVPAIAVPFSNRSPIHNVKDYGAVGDGSTMDTRSINSAIQTAAESGGGIVFFPAGEYLSESIHLLSNITLYLDQGAVLVAAPPDSPGYDSAEQAVNDLYQDYGHSHFHNSFIWGEHLHDIAITGQGMIWGKGLVRGYMEENPDYPNKSIALYDCRSVLIRDVTIKHGGWFGILATGVNNLTIANLKIDTNRDGMDIDCCQNVRISDCTVNSPDDDAICLKSSYALGYPKTTENVTITNCQVSGYLEGSLLDGTNKRISRPRQAPIGRIKMGTESNGGFINIAISNCVFDYCRGLALESVDGAFLEDITISNITMRNITNSPIFIRLGARMRAPEEMKVGKCRRILLSDINIYNAMDSSSACIISGIPGHNIEDLFMKNIHIYYKGGGTKEMAQVKVDEDEQLYPEPSKFGTIPAYGFYIRHVNNMEMSDIRLSYENTDQRPPFKFVEVHNVSLRNIHAERERGVPGMVKEKASGIKISDFEGIPDSD